ncbi:hypothetical protein SNE40_009456 [Patella caerulea]|uniref:Nuclear RNA export factor 1 n=1 Tax=Patella caerulea TaxID=87958 RepID=A0AAN8Q399_PATCE
MSRFRSDNEFTVTTGRDGHRSFSEHDDRWGPRPQRHRGGGGKVRGGGGYGRNNSGRGSREIYRPPSYGRGPRGISKPGRGKSVTFNPRSRLDVDGDDAMGSEDRGSGRQRFNPYSARPPSRRGGRRYHSDRDRGNSSRQGGEHSTWWKVTIPHGKKCEKDFLIKTIQSLISCGSFTPVQFHYENKNAVFYLDDDSVAKAVRATTNKATLPNGFKMIVVVSPTSRPSFVLTDESKVKLKEAMSARYDPSTKVLDLNTLHKDTSLQADGLYMSLNKINVMSEVINIIRDNIPELVCLILRSNKIHSLNGLQGLVSVTPNLMSLDLSDNELKTIEELDKIKTWNLESLKLDLNVLCDSFKDKTSYISAVRKRFSNIVNLDGNVLPPTIKFDLEANTTLLPTKGSFFSDETLKALIVKFLREFYSIYDSDNRHPLKEAYFEEATFSLAASYNGGLEYRQPNLQEYTPESRNLIKGSGTKNLDRNYRLLKRGKIAIASQLCLLPKTSHDPNSFVVDVGVVTPNMMSFSLIGVFKESDSKTDKPPIRAFSRHFVAVPSGQGILITNDTLTITNASPQQVQVAFKNTGPTPSSSPVSSNPPALPNNMSITEAPSTSGGLTPTQQQMLQQFATVSNMNLEWSAKCLQENGWNYEKAGLIFIELNKAGKIPPAAFIK